MGKQKVNGIRIIFLTLVLSAISCGIGFGMRVSKAALKLEQAYINSPTVRTYLTGGDVETLDGMLPETRFQDVSLDYAQDAHIYDPVSDGGTEYIYVVEISKYVTKQQRETICEELQTAVNLLQDKDLMTVYTFGDTFSAGQPTQVSGNTSDSDKENAKKAIQKQLKSKENTSHLWNAVTNVLDRINQSSGEGPQRRVAVFITGGNYKKTTSNNDKDDVKAQIASATKNVACYMVQLKTKSKVDGSEASVFTESGGEKYSEKAMGSISACFDQFRKVMESTIVATFHATDSTVFDDGGSVSIKAGDTWICENRHMYAAYAWQDNAAGPTLLPVAEGSEAVIKKEDASSISFTFSEPVKGAEAIKNYSITRGDGIKLDIQSLRYDVRTNVCMIVFGEDLFTDNYTMNISNITDIDHNPIAVEPSQIAFHIEGRDEQVYKVVTFLKNYWWIILISVTVLILLIVYVVIRSHGGIVEQGDGKKGFANATTVTVGISTPKTKKIVLTMADSYGKRKEIICNIDSSIFVGRDKMCEIHTDDDKMSRQHFVIESTQLGFFITDLDTTNGTLVNGTKLTKRQMLTEGDTISAGRETFVFGIYHSEG